MRLKLFTIAMVIFFVLFGCQTANKEEDRTSKRDTKVEQTRHSEGNRQNTWDRTEDRRDQRNVRDNRTQETRDGQLDTRYDVSKEAAEKITDQIEEINYAYVLTTNNNAYVSAVLDNDRNRSNDKDNQRNRNDKNHQSADEGEELTDEVKQEISDIVRSVDDRIDNVFVTTNPDFADLTNNYINDMNEGKPVRGMFDQIGNMIERLFPENK